jgi:PAS domain S-box-containing protein
VRCPPFIRGIRDKLIVAFSALVAAIALFVFAFFPARLERQAMSATLAKSAAIREMAAYSLRAGLLFEDTVAVHEVLAGAARARDVSFLAVWNTAGRLVASQGTGIPRELPVATTDGLISADGRTLIATIDIASASTKVGTLALGISLVPLRAEIAQARQVGALVGVLILVVGIFAIFAISTFVTRPITALAKTVNRIAAGDLESRATETNDVEVRQLVVAFNHMIDTIAVTQSELASINEKLEARVASRTEQLTEAIEEQMESQIVLALSESEARRTSELLQSLINLAPQAIVAVDTERRVTRWNLAAEELFGWSAREVIGKLIPCIPIDQQPSDSPCDVATAQRTEPIEVIRQRKDGSRVAVLLAAGGLRDREHRAAGTIGIFTDLTERKRLEEQLRQSQKMEALGRLAGGIAHDFNNILTIISACTELLLAERRDEEEQAQLEHIAGASARAAALTRQLLTFTRQQVIQLQPVDLGGVVRALEPMLRRVLPANIRLTATISRDTGVIHADPSQLEQVVMNLVVNASDAMPQGGALDVELSLAELDDASAPAIRVQAGRYNRLVIRDTGVGIDEATLARIFEPFFTTKAVGQGTGLGLTTAYGIVTALGGSIRVHSTPGQGTTFELHLPESEQRARDEEGDAPRPLPPAIAPSPSTSTILLVEDEQAVRHVVRRTLERSGYSVLEATDGEEGLAMVAEHGATLQAVVTDMMMPGMSGLALAESVRATHPALGVVCISGYTESGVSGNPMFDANRFFLQKPFTREQLVAAINSVVRESSSSIPA